MSKEERYERAENRMNDVDEGLARDAVTGKILIGKKAKSLEKRKDGHKENIRKGSNLWEEGTKGESHWIVTTN